MSLPPQLQRFKGIAKTFGVDLEQVAKEFTDAFNKAIQPTKLYTIRKDGVDVEVDYDIGHLLVGIPDEGIPGEGWEVVSRRPVVKIEWNEHRFFVPLLDVPTSTDEVRNRLTK